MDWMSNTILIGSGLIVVSILSSIFAYRFGTPLLLIFLGIGLIVGEDGLGIEFNDAEHAYFIGSLALAVILFDSGFGTRAQTLRRSAVPAFTLATIGVFLTTIFVGVAAHFLLGLPWLYAFLMGAIISSTDAAAVFFLLRTGGVKIYKRVRSTLEVESGSNDPMAIFLTVLFIELITFEVHDHLAVSFIRGFGTQMGLGLLVGLVGGFVIVEVVKRTDLEEALYSILVMSCALCVFGIAAYWGGSGFLAIYVAGVVAGNQKLKGEASLRRYQRGMTWLAQIVMFLILGLFVTPSEFGPVLVPALLLGLFLIFIARPVAVFLCLLPLRIDWPSTTFTAWVGLRGAVSILLGVLPAVMGVANADIFINVAFIMVVTSLLVQGWTIKPAAKWLKLIVPSGAGPLERIELELPGNPAHELLIYRVMEDSPLIKSQTSIPRWAHPSLIVRNGRSMQYISSQNLVPGDLVYVFTPPEYRLILDRLFSQSKPPDREDKGYFGQFYVKAEAKLVDLLKTYDPTAITSDISPDLSVGDFLCRELDSHPVTGDRVSIGIIDLIVRSVHQGKTVMEVGLSIIPEKKPYVSTKRHVMLKQVRDRIATALKRR